MRVVTVVNAVTVAVMAVGVVAKAARASAALGLSGIVWVARRWWMPPPSGIAPNGVSVVNAATVVAATVAGVVSSAVAVIVVRIALSSVRCGTVVIRPRRCRSRRWLRHRVPSQMRRWSCIRSWLCRAMGWPWLARRPKLSVRLVGVAAGVVEVVGVSARTGCPQKPRLTPKRCARCARHKKPLSLKGWSVPKAQKRVSKAVRVQRLRWSRVRVASRAHVVNVVRVKALKTEWSRGLRLRVLKLSPTGLACRSLRPLCLQPRWSPNGMWP